MFYKKIPIIFVCLNAFFISVKAQTISTKLQPSDKSIIYLPTRLVLDTTTVAHIPFKKYPHWSLRRMAVYNVQAMYENIPDTDVRRNTAFNNFIENYKINRSYLTKTKIRENYIYLATALDELGNKHVIIDANNNLDFQDDKEYILAGGNDAAVFTTPIKYFDGKNIVNGTVDLQASTVKPLFRDDYYKSEIDKKLDIMINMILVNKAGDVKVNDQLFKINVLNYDGHHPNSGFDVNVQKVPFDTKNNNDYNYKSKDTLEINGNLYTVKLLSDSILTIYYAGKSVNKGGETETFAPCITGADITTKQTFSLQAQKGKYVLIDFWGSWCGPCIRLIPEVKKMHAAFADKIQFVSIAYDKPADLAKVQKLIDENSMSWVQLLDNSSEANTIANQYKVNEFPTSLLIDPTGKIVYRGIGADGLKNLTTFYNAAIRAH